MTQLILKHMGRISQEGQNAAQPPDRRAGSQSTQHANDGTSSYSEEQTMGPAMVPVEEVDDEPVRLSREGERGTREPVDDIVTIVRSDQIKSEGPLHYGAPSSEPGRSIPFVLTRGPNRTYSLPPRSPIPASEADTKLTV